MASESEGAEALKSPPLQGTNSIQSAATQIHHGLPTPLTATTSSFPTTIMQLPLRPKTDDPESPGKRRGDGIEEDTATGPFGFLGLVQRPGHSPQKIAVTVWPPESGLSPPRRNKDPNVPFSAYKAIIRHPNLFFQFALRLPLDSIINLYAIDKEFHYRFNKFNVSLIHDYAKLQAPLASYIFSWALYPGLLLSDPNLRPMDNRAHLARDVPGFRWVKMVVWRQHVVHEILTELQLDGHRVPKDTERALMKFWVLMEQKTTGKRNAFLQDKTIWSDTDICLFQLFLIKLDMRLSDPVTGNGPCELSRLLLTQRSMSLLWKVLIGKYQFNYDEMGDIVVLTYLTEDLDTEVNPWIEDEEDSLIPSALWGLLSHENWSTDSAPMSPALDMLIAESVRRGLNPAKFLLDFALYGYVDFNTGENIPVPYIKRSDKQITIPKEGWPGPVDRALMMQDLNTRYDFEPKPSNLMMLFVLRGLLGEGDVYVPLPFRVVSARP